MTGHIYTDQVERLVKAAEKLAESAAIIAKYLQLASVQSQIKL